MKICPYCGNENSDDAKVCSIDQTPLDSEAPVEPHREAPRAKTAVDLTARPFTVVFGAQLLVAWNVFGLVLDIVSYHRYFHRFPNFQYPHYYLPIVGTYGFWALIIYLIYRGKNWARWIASCVIVLGIILAPFMQIGHLPWLFYFNSLICLASVVALFQRSSNEWYKGSKKILSEPASVV